MKLSWQTEVLMLLLFFALLPILVFTVLVSVPLNPLHIDKICISNPDKIVIAGEPIYYTIQGMKNTDKPSKVIRQLINERIIYYTPIESNLVQGTTKLNSSLVTSKGDAPGKYYIRWTAIYTYFYFRDVVVTAESDIFTMLAPGLYKGEKGEKGDKGDKGNKGKQGIQGETIIIDKEVKQLD